MQTQITFREFRETDYDVVAALWHQCEGVEVAEGDDASTILGYLKRNSNLSRVAMVDERVVGAVLCGHDGRRGFLYHLAVADDQRGHGIGRMLVAECIARLGDCGIQRAIILVADDNPKGRCFWTAQGFEEISGTTAFGIDIAPLRRGTMS
jgi:N-acetylglutamate synthase